ncbi:TetR/AcrR family transcriptional regulator [Natronoflexus pectinivorans]|uniref:TetR family transcriptional regulator n=1 Tax=Natronoflexus pectinivorans TaxID=682526 RepID=A0A4R2GLL1_9BACT|nr:TetR/AcrR family transcriptional regulator [Natronoflexus pectinivorans]TCO09894.1 TetR family transcriptional regulator [Natronoflexus pectinivorans]
MEIRERILDTAGKMFFTEGIRRVTMDAIARKMGMSKRTIYEIFKDKNEILRASIADLIDKNELELNELKERSANSMELIVGAFEFGIKAINEVNPVYFEDLELYHPELWNETMYRRKQESYRDFQNLVKQGIKEGFFREKLNVPLVAKIFIEQMNAMHRRDVFPAHEYPAAELFETLFLNYIRGISTYAGIEKLEELLLSKLK